MKISARPLLIAAALAGIAVAAWWSGLGRKENPLADLLIAEAKTGDVIETVEATGTLRPVRLVAVGAQVSGRITAMRVKVGDPVKAGDLVATIDDLTQQNTSKSAEAALVDLQAQKRGKEASLAYAEAALAREQATFARSASSKDALESARSTVATTRAAIDSLAAQITEAEVKVDTARVDLGYTRITAPSDGTVLLVVAQEGQTVNAAQSAPTIVVLGRIDRMTVRTEISEADVPRVAVGQKTSFTILGAPDRLFEASLERIDPAPDTIRSDSAVTGTSSTTSSSSSSSSSASSTAVYYYGWFDVPNPDGLLKTYMTAQVKIVTGEARGVVTIPKAALSPAGPKGERGVEVVGADGKTTTRAVTIGRDDKTTVEIRSGLSAGERVVTGRRSTETKTSSMPPPPGGL
ncbi:MAG: efflux RND transporter periplasmic adaptor subunit [Phyllobacteriaceae bacterium]|nr:efflux RND transporter periplasmic adaptor subunit [Phyllobacteriaceae bacterium]